MYLRSNLINNVTACEVPNLVWISNADIECRFRGLFNAHTWLCLALLPIYIGGWLYRWRPTKPGTIFFQITRFYQTGATKCWWKGGRWRRAASGNGFFLGRSRSLISGCRTCLGGCLSERAKRVNGIINGFQTSRLRADFAGSSWAAATRRTDLAAAD